MKRYITVRLLQVVPTILFIIVFNFVLIRIAPGDPAQIMAGDFATQELVEQTRARYGLDQPIPVQLFAYLGSVLSGDLGYSYDYNRPVLDVILERLPATLILVLTAQILGILLGMALGVFAARRPGSVGDFALVTTTSILYSVPVFWLGLVAILLFGVEWGLLPTSSMRSIMGPTEGWPLIADVLTHLILPAGTLMLAWILPIFFRITRSSVLEVMNADFVTTARAKGLSDRLVFRRHALRNALLPSVTMIGLTLGTAVSGALLTETVFSWPGIGRLMLEGIDRRDYPMLMGIFIFTSVCVVIATLLTDLVYRWLDPRVELAKR
ncbi:MAG: ABC transporter permease [Azospirillaceae bacterium]